ncbi:MAG: tRNA pseudouridine(55) synthase TruB [Desulfovibrio sp.]|uniref:tRNA pseudouridine(55) synthase TruB n=1 Tax=Desulfovibrio sp. TaxID=885 RepID=UPI0039E400B4
MPQQHGVLVLNKPSGPTSARCLTAIKRLGQKKIGHAGTLDPLASGVLLVLLGQATKLSGHLLAGGGKVYSGELRLGQTTDTWDIEGQVIDEAPWQHISEEDVRREVAAWLELTEQAVPPYSAAKHEGQPLYKLARKGLDAPQKIKRMKISQADVLEISLPLVRFRVACSSGTYIRSLAHSLGSRLGCGAVLTELTREYSHPFGLDVARDPADFTADPALLSGCVIPVADALPHWPRVDLTPEEAARVRNGIAVPCRTPQADTGNGEDLAFLMEQGHALALAQREATAAGPCWAVLRGLWN